jgi:hypothetical protein
MTSLLSRERRRKGENKRNGFDYKIISSIVDLEYLQDTLI